MRCSWRRWQRQMDWTSRAGSSRTIFKDRQYDELHFLAAHSAAMVRSLSMSVPSSTFTAAVGILTTLREPLAITALRSSTRLMKVAIRIQCNEAHIALSPSPTFSPVLPVVHSHGDPTTAVHAVHLDIELTLLSSTRQPQDQRTVTSSTSRRVRYSVCIRIAKAYHNEPVMCRSRWH